MVNRLTPDKLNAALKPPNITVSVGVSRTEKTSLTYVCATRDQGQQSVLVMRRLLAKSYCMRSLQVDDTA